MALLLHAIDQADRVEVHDSRIGRGQTLYVSEERADLQSLKTSIMVKPPEGWYRCACIPSTTITFLKAKKELGFVEIFEGEDIHYSEWTGDATVADRKRWFAWLDSRGVTSPHKEFDEQAALAKQDQKDEEKWRKAMPSSLLPLWQHMTAYRPVPGQYETKFEEIAISKQYPQANSRILALMSWFGSGAGPWSGFPGYEDVPERMLLKYSTADLVAAVSSKPLTDPETEGAARFFAGWEFNRTRPNDLAKLPDSLRKTFLEHSLKSKDEDNVERAKNSFAAKTTR